MNTQTPISLKVQQTSFGKTTKGEDVLLFTISNDFGMSLKVMDYGATITHLMVPDRSGKLTDVVLGFDTFEEYKSEAYHKANAFMGCAVGRVCNRIHKGKFSLNGIDYQLAQTNGDHHLHGGEIGFDKKIWSSEVLEDGVAFHYTSPDGEENYPGELKVTVRYRLVDGNALRIEYEASTTKATVVNFTNHSYFNLSGDLSQSALDHQLQVNAPWYIPVIEGSIPTGEILSVKDTPFDFLAPRKVREAVFSSHAQIKIGNGLDQTLVFGKEEEKAKLKAEETGITMTVHSSEPGMQVYTANYFDGSLTGKGKNFPQHAGIAMETQHFPDSPNQPHFPSVVLRPQEKFESFTSYQFSAE